MAHRWTLLALLLGVATAGCPSTRPDDTPAPANEVEPIVEAPVETVPVDDPFAPPTEAVQLESGADAEAMREAIVAAMDLAASGDLDAAKVEFQQLLYDDDVAAYAAYNLGVIAYYEGDIGQSRDYFETAAETDPAFAEPLAALVRIALRQGDVTTARRHVNDATAASDDAPQVRAVELLIDVYEGDYDGVVRRSRSILLEDTGNLDVFYALAVAHMELGRDELAEYVINEAIGRDATRPEFYFLLGRMELRADNYPGARLQFEQVLERDPYNAEAWNNLGVIQLESRDFDGAIESFGNALAYTSEYPEAWMNLGNAQKGLQRYAEAEEAFLEASRLDSEYPDPWFNLGVLYLDAEMEGFTRIERLERCLQHFGEFRVRASAIPNDHPVNGYTAEAQSLLDTERDLERQAAEDAEREASGGDDWGGDGGDGGSSDEWGDDGGGDDWGDDGGDGGGSDDWGDDGGGDDWGDGGGSDDWGDDGGGDDWGDDGGGDDWGDDGGGSDDWGDDGETSSDGGSDAGDEGSDEGDSDDWSDSDDGWDDAWEDAE